MATTHEPSTIHHVTAEVGVFTITRPVCPGQDPTEVAAALRADLADDGVEANVDIVSTPVTAETASMLDELAASIAAARAARRVSR